MKLTELKQKSLANEALSLCRLAGAKIVDIYHSVEPLKVDRKQDDSPVTIADHCAHDIISTGLQQLTPQWPVLSEEEDAPPFEVRSHWPCYWLVDPLDGTLEFIERSGEFTINIALVIGGLPVIGLIYLPLQQLAYIGLPEYRQAWRDENGTQYPLKVAAVEVSSSVRVFTSSRYRNAALLACIKQLERSFSAVQWLKAGSAVKFCRLVDGEGDIYPRFSPCCEWDTAAGQALLEAAGGKLVDMDFTSLKYNQSPSLINPSFYALGGGALSWWQSVLIPKDSV